MTARHLLHYSIVSAHTQPPTQEEVARAMKAAGVGSIDRWQAGGPGDPSSLVARFAAYEPDGTASASVEISLQGERVVGEVNRSMFLVLARSLGKNDARILKRGQLSLEVEVSVKDSSSLTYLNWTIWLIDVLLNVTDGVVIDPAAQCCRGRAEWEKCAGPFDISRHVALHVTEWERETRWVHSHGMEKFARPDLELVEVSPSLVREAMLLINQLAASLARGARLQAGQTISIGTTGDVCLTQSTSPADHQEPFGRLRLIDVPTPGQPSPTHANTLLVTGAYLEGCHLAETSQLEQALETFTRVLQANPKSEAALGAKASTLLVAQRPEQALAVARELEQTNANNPDGYYLASQALIAQRRYEEALEILSLAIQRGIHDKSMYEARSHCLLALNRSQEALADLAIAAQIAEKSL